MTHSTQQNNRQPTPASPTPASPSDFTLDNGVESAPTPRRTTGTH